MRATDLRPWRRVAGLAALTVLLGITSWTDSSAAPRIRTGNPEGGSSSNEEGQKSDPKVLGKLDEILTNQQTIMSRLDEVMEELKIVKIRATLR